jgi:hypothetical protein
VLPPSWITLLTPICNVLGVLFKIYVYFHSKKLNKLQLNTISISPNTAGQSLVGLSFHLHAITVPQRIFRH